MTPACPHVGRIRPVTPSADGCEECLKTGDRWVHLRICMVCGHVGCCDSSPNTHATKHFHATGHPVIKSFEPGEDWGWCYVDGVAIPSVRRHLRRNRDAGTDADATPGDGG